MSNDVAIKIEGLKKQYKLGQIGGGTLTADLQSWWARIHGKEDPNSKIGAGMRSNGETFMALNGIDLTVKKGEALGIIGTNGAGKSTLLKILSNITAPTEGKAYIYGRISSMLEVGTGFSPEMTGRENIYMNGAILGMTKAEIDAKMEQIIDFSEVREFIDTPVKRYSSGMYVKLAFSVAAHLDSEIMIMDEVLAVGDMKFQQKCLDKMSDAARVEGKTVLYVSHNMNTIRRLCSRCVVLDKGKIIFDGDVETAIGIYLNNNKLLATPHVDLAHMQRPKYSYGHAHMLCLDFLNTDNCVYQYNQKIDVKLCWENPKNLSEIRLRTLVMQTDGTPVGIAISDVLECNAVHTIVENKLTYSMPCLVEGRYYMTLSLFQNDSVGNSIIIDTIERACAFEISGNKDGDKAINWPAKAWGSIHFPDIMVVR